jgi:hypothetical protein
MACLVPVRPCQFFANEFATFVFCLPFDRSPRQLLLFSRARVAFNFSERLVSSDGHDLACRPTGFG